MYETDARKFWTTWNKENVDKYVCYMHSPNDFAQQFFMNFSSKWHDGIVNIDLFKKSTCKEKLTECVSMITVEEDVELAVHLLNMSKCLDCEKLCIFHVLLAHPAIHCCLALLFNAMNIYGQVPNQLGLSVVIPTLKCNTQHKVD